MKSNFCVAPRCPRGSLVPNKIEEQNSCPVYSMCCSSLFQRQSRPIMKGGADQPCSLFSVLPLAVPSGSLVPYQREEQISCSFHSVMCCSSLSHRQSCPIQKRGASLLWGSPYGENCACGMPCRPNVISVLILTRRGMPR